MARPPLQDRRRRPPRLPCYDVVDVFVRSAEDRGDGRDVDHAARPSRILEGTNVPRDADVVHERRDRAEDPLRLIKKGTCGCRIRNAAVDAVHPAPAPLQIGDKPSGSLVVTQATEADGIVPGSRGSNDRCPDSPAAGHQQDVSHSSSLRPTAHQVHHRYNHNTIFKRNGSRLQWQYCPIAPAPTSRQAGWSARRPASASARRPGTAGLELGGCLWGKPLKPVTLDLWSPVRALLPRCRGSTAGIGESLSVAQGMYGVGPGLDRMQDRDHVHLSVPLGESLSVEGIADVQQG